MITLSARRSAQSIDFNMAAWSELMLFLEGVNKGMAIQFESGCYTEGYVTAEDARRLAGDVRLRRRDWPAALHWKGHTTSARFQEFVGFLEACGGFTFF